MVQLTEFIKEHLFFPVFDLIGVPILVVLVIFLFIAETIWILRDRRISRWKRIKTNISIAAVALFALRILLIPVLVFLARWANMNDIGLINLIDVPVWLSWVIGFLLLDYANYLWHVLNHKLPILWRFHNIHHIDLDLDLTTAIRFHFGEVLLSVFFRGLMVILIGAPAILVLVYEIFFEAATNFHHTNWRLPYWVEKNLAYIIVTPRMHGIHHSIVQRETNSNYSVIFNSWDRLHKTILLNISQQDIDIGVPAYRDPKEQTVKNLLSMPFKSQRPWKLPDGTVPEREQNNANPNHLAP